LTLLLVHPGYGWYQEAYLRTLAESFRLRVVSVFDDAPDDRMPDSLRESMQRVTLGGTGVRVRHYRPRSLARLVTATWQMSAGADCVLTSTQNPVHAKVAWAVARLRGIPLLVVVEQWRGYSDQGLASRLYNGLSRHVMRVATRCFVHGARAAEFCERMGVRSERIRVYPHMNADLRQLRRTPEDSEAFRFLFVGRLVQVKGLDVLIRSFARVRAEGVDTELVICGDGILRDELEALAASLQVRVVFRGLVPSAKVPDVMSSASAFVLPSRTSGAAYEGWGLVVGEAASLSKPLIVTTAVGSAPELVRDGENGFVVAEDDVEALSAAMLRLALEPEKAAMMGAASRRIWEAYADPTRCVDLIREALRDV
jgi:glycosyltransferase involved in cell wall biosynthesis